MGILPGMEVSVVRLGPFGNLLKVTAATGQSFVLRKGETASIEYKIVSLPLTGTSPGPTICRIRGFQGGMGFRHKMADRGLAVGTKLRVRKAHPYLIYLLPDGPLATVGRGEAKKLMVEPLEEGGHA